LKIAVVAITKHAVGLAEKTAALLAEEGRHEAVLHLPGKFSLLRIEGQRQPYRKPLRELFGELFSQYEGIVCIMALGIVVRVIAPYLKDKTSDPAVVAMDEMGRNVISVLSGHLGGANALALEIAVGLGANPVITTGTDVHGLPAIEMLARENGWVAEPFELVKKVNASIVNGYKITIYSEYPLHLEPREHIEVKDFAAYSPARKEQGRVVLVTNRTAQSFPPGCLFLRPRNLCVGVGCRKGASCEEICEAVLSAIAESGRTAASVRSLASIDIKSSEEGLLEAAGELSLPLEFFTGQAVSAVLSQRGKELGFSELVYKKIGVGGVCEPAAILGAGETSALIMQKTKYGKVTVAIAEDGSR